jgi:hypothetical protein
MYIAIKILMGTAFLLWGMRPFRHARNRRYDLKVLWPTMKDQAQNLEHARIGFIIHTATDPSWRYLLDDWDEDKFNEWVETVLV